MAGDLCASQLHEKSLLSLLVKESEEGAEVGVCLEHVFSATMGLFMVLRKSVYARGGLIGVLIESSCLMAKSANPGNVLRAEFDRADSSEGKVEVMGVLSCGSLGLDEDIVLLGGGRIGALAAAGADVWIGDSIMNKE